MYPDTCKFEDADFLRHLYTLCDPNASYDFADVIVVQDIRDGKVYAAYDSGCSCPTPFESHIFPTDFAEVRSTGDLLNFIQAQYPKYDMGDVNNALAMVRGALENKPAKVR